MRPNSEFGWMPAVGAILGLMGVLIGAFGAHALRGRLTPAEAELYKTGVIYHLVHAMAMLVAANSISIGAPHRLLRLAGWLFAAGIVLFSGSLYLLAISALRWWGAITPIGGICFLTGWVVLTVALVRASAAGAAGPHR